jgi:hypothetical protein
MITGDDVGHRHAVAIVVDDGQDVGGLGALAFLVSERFAALASAWLPSRFRTDKSNSS